MSDNTARYRALEALQKRQAAADEALERNRQHHDSQAQDDYIRATHDLAEQWLKLAAIEAGFNPYQPDPQELDGGYIGPIDQDDNAGTTAGTNLTARSTTSSTPARRTRP